jgi:hypothetical protein
MAEPSFTPERPSGDADRWISHDDHIPRFYTIREAAELCMRSEGTVRNLVSLYGLRTKTAWTVYRRHRRRVTLLNGVTVAWLREVTLFRNAAAKAEGPPR